MEGLFPDENRTRVPTRLVVLSIVGLWAVYFALASMRGLALGIEHQSEMLWRRGLVSLAGFAVTLALWWALRSFDGRRFWLIVGSSIVLAVPAAMALAWVNNLAFAPLEKRYIEEQAKKSGLEVRLGEDGAFVLVPPASPPTSDGDPLDQSQMAEFELRVDSEGGWYQIVQTAYGRYFLLLAWCALYFAMLTVERARDAERREGEFRRAAREAELRSLRYQVNPHFLFNTLNSLSALILTGKNERAEAMVQSIASFYRQSLTSEPTGDVLLSEEFDLQRNYLEIEAVRFPERLRVRFDLPRALENARIPGMILQPLVENSVKYGVAESVEPVTITLAAREEFGRLVLTVSDDGPKGGEQSQEPGHGIGLTNVRQRLAARFAGEASVASGPTGDGYATHIRIPLVI